MLCYIALPFIGCDYADVTTSQNDLQGVHGDEHPGASIQPRQRNPSCVTVPVLSHIVSHTLYKRRHTLPYFVQCVVGGLDEQGSTVLTPYSPTLTNRVLLCMVYKCPPL